ncbi:pyruvate kinase-like isoform X2 [Amphibalanus amphitrite]|uniref:pyruvate kinase-like isoform X2 n=1 Tax=Amphibalanus amphitrite TaxID=1232801 RepID=UPI001C90A17F|nr:pyruvate kinase-like isoform X2 [Amphibalanus amphitrite]
MVANFCERLFTAQFHHAGFAVKNLRDFQLTAGRRWASHQPPGPVPPPARAGSRLQYLASLDVRTPPTIVRRTGIVCTIGPACDSLEAMSALTSAGMTVARLNMSHGSRAEHSERVRRLRRACALCPDSPPLAVALDTRGPELRTGTLHNQDGSGSVRLVAGSSVRLTSDPHYRHRSCARHLYVDYSGLAGCVRPGDPIHLDDGLISLRVSAVDGDSVLCAVETGGELGSRKSVCVPGAALSLPAVTEQDREDLRLAAALPVDLVFASFVRDRDGVRQLRRALGEDGRHIKIISKIESLEGLLNIDSIIAESDGVMVARGDMGVELPPEKVFIAQKSIIAKCNMAGKPAICATQMMETMVTRPRPTRAELADVANAVLDGADCVMLSAETASGAFPLETVRLMDKTCRQAEAVLDFEETLADIRSQVCASDPELARAAEVVRHAREAGAAAILVPPGEEDTALQLARFRQPCPVIMMTSSEQTARQSRLQSGVVPFVLQDNDTHRDVIQRATDRVRSLGLVRSGDTIALTTTPDGHLQLQLITV